MGKTTRDLALYTPELADTVEAFTNNLGSNFEAIDVAHSDHVGSTGASHGTVTSLVNGFMSSTDKDKLDGIEAGAKDDQSWGEITGTLSNQTDLQIALNNAEEVFEYSNSSNFPVEGESAKIYIALDTNLPYRWNGTSYIEISKSLELGETSTTAYRGDRGKEAYDNYINTISGDGNSAITLTKRDASTISTNTAHNHDNATTSVNGFMSSTDKTKLDGIDDNANNYSLESHDNTHHSTNYATETNFNAHTGATGNAHGVVTTSVNGFMSAADKTKLNGVQAGAQVNSVTSVVGKTGVVSLVKADVGLSNVDNLSAASIRSGTTKADVGLSNVDNIKQAPNTHLSASGAHSAQNISLSSTNFSSNEVRGALNELFTSVSNGKGLIATAITDKGVPTSGGDSFSIMAGNIGNISSASIKATQRGELYFSDSEGQVYSKSVSVSPVDPSKCILIYSVRTSSTDPDSSTFRTTINASSINFTRGDPYNYNSTYLNISWFLIEFNNVNVQWGSVTFPDMAHLENVTLSPIDLSKSFVVVSVSSTGNTNHSQIYTRTLLTSSTNLEIRRGATRSSSETIVNWRVVEGL